MARADVDTARLYKILHRAKTLGLANLNAIIQTRGIPRGWPEDLARRYLTHHLTFDIGPRELNAIRLFHRYAADEQLIEYPRELHVAGS